MSVTRTSPRRLGLSLAVCLALMGAQSAWSGEIKPYWSSKSSGPRSEAPIDIPPSEWDLNYSRDLGFRGATGNPYVLGFEAISQYDNAALGRNFIPPDTIGAVGKTQYMATTNGSYAVFDKYTGARQQLWKDTDFWTAAGQIGGTNGDTRVMYNASNQRWIAVAFGANTKDLMVAVSNDSNALGGWKSVKFEGYAGFGFGATADYPTLAMDRNAVYIGTNNFAPLTSGGASNYRGTTLNAIPINSLFNASGPSVANMMQFNTPYNGAGSVDRGFALQGVNSNSASGPGKIVAASAFNYDNVAYTINGLSADSASGATQGDVQYLGVAAFTAPGAGRQPADVAANRRIVSTLDERISSSVYEVNGRIYSVQTVDSTADGLDESRIRYTVIDAQTFAVLAQGDIGEAGYDYYQGSLAVNSQGQVVVGYNRSGLDAATGKISFMARAFATNADGSLSQLGGELLLKESLTNDYHNGSGFGLAAVGRQRWGDYSAVSVDPEDELNFYLIGQYAREYNRPEDGHPGGTGGSRWSTWVAQVNVAQMVPEPETYALFLTGVLLLAFVRRRAD
ncbi:PEP-CTERM sorting domain-containing protein [Roseateles sp. BYS180W]|uniref:PEP-CTERM sorting domain-containing protein n=1 Tax=Roseateles rivi TaxID=3299028 RepID=A0ABW7FWP6_9BURK